MVFNSKPLLYLQILDRSIRYLAVHAKDGSIIEQDEIVFDAEALDDGEIVNHALLETRLDALVKEKKWKNAKTHILLSNKFIVLREETIPAQLGRNEIRDYLNLHIGHSIRIPYDDPIFDFQVTERNEEEQKIFIIAYPRNKVEEYQKLLQKVSLKPTVADITTLGLYRIAEKEGIIDKENAHTLILEWNPYDTAFMVYHQDRPTFFRQSQSSSLSDSWKRNAAHEWVWKYSDAELDMALNEQLNGLERFLDFYSYSVLQGEGSVTEIILSGYYPDLEEIKSELIARFPMDVTILPLPEGIEQSFDALYGLSLKENKQKEKKEPKERTKRRFEKEKGEKADD